MSVGEFDIIEKFFRQLTHSRDDVHLAIGDDCALVLPEKSTILAVTTDTLVAGTHFFANTDPEKLGHKCLAVNLSDLAAMGAKPCWVSLALTLPQVNENWITAFARGFATLANLFNVQLIGGDLTKGPLSITITAHGQVDRHKALTRSGALKDHLIYVSGQLGSASLALKQILDHDNALPAVLDDALHMPFPRVELGQLLAGHASACIDISDGLLADLGHICEASACGAEIQLDQIPCHRLVYEEIQTTQDWHLALTGGDDYELCFTVPPDQQTVIDKISGELDLYLTQIGKITDSGRIAIFDQDGKIVDISGRGYAHF